MDLVPSFAQDPYARTEIANADYTALVTDRHIAYTSISATRTVTLPSAAAFPKGVPLEIADESGSVTTAITITIVRAGSDTITGGGLGGVLGAVNLPYQVTRFVSDGTSKWAMSAEPAGFTMDGTFPSPSNSATPSVAAVATYVNTPKVSTIASAATLAPVGTNDMYTVTALAVAATTISNPSGTPLNGHLLRIRIKDNGTARALTWSGTKWRASAALAFPTTTIISKTHYIEVIYNSTDDRWDLARVDSYT